jgi:hypothetical protein
MKTKILRRIGFSALVAMYLAACCTNPTTPPITEEASKDMIPSFFGKNVVLATGIDFQTGKPVVLNPMTGEQQKPCNSGTVIVNSDKNPRQALRQHATVKAGADVASNESDCNTQIVDPSSELLNALSSSDKIINGTIRKNGKDVPARFVVSVAALYEGSNCVTYISGGKEYDICSTLQGDCNLILPLSVYGVKNETIRRNVRNTCMQFVNPWKRPDCRQLHPIYRTASNYTLAYKRFVYDTCRTLPQNPPLNWGVRP